MATEVIQAATESRIQPQQPRLKRIPVREKSSKAAAAAFQPSDCSSDAEALSKKVKAVVRKSGAQ